MNTLIEKISDVNDLILQGKALEAFETYYHDDVIMQENDHAACVGKSLNREREKAFFDAIEEFKCAKPLKVTIGEQTTMVEWELHYVHKEYGEKRYSQVAVQEWREGKIIKEKFYYGS
ncbi:nuclear transport factor 2 family protein [Gaetbulibacter saemankumensis]|uniref:nuclear transport factor 2 family protein n=1 Tax=Gaetbulibacter saemankumensis TaxID=311208 RepID=UPI00040D7812|nr:nuclear transport factor 2 family protein [Gaetbulibacter saemankumensis]